MAVFNANLENFEKGMANIEHLQSLKVQVIEKFGKRLSDPKEPVALSGPSFLIDFENTEWLLKYLKRLVYAAKKVSSCCEVCTVCCSCELKKAIEGFNEL